MMTKMCEQARSRTAPDAGRMPAFPGSERRVPDPCCARSRRSWVGALPAFFLLACGTAPPAEPPPADGETWAVTAWGERFEVFPEVDALVAGQAAEAHTHVTRLADFTPVVDGRVEIVLVGASGEQVFGADQVLRPGIFDIEVTPRQAGDVDVLFRIHDAEGTEEIRGGRVRVGTADDPGGLLDASSPPAGSDGGEPISFLKEQQWQSSFATAWVEEGRLAESVAGLATFRPPAGGESTVTAQVDGVVQPAEGSPSWPFVGRYVARDSPLFRVVPLVAAERSLATLEAELETLATELESALARRSRLEELLALEATSKREVEEAGVRVRTLQARRRAAERDLESARTSREGGAEGSGPLLRAPFAGQIAEVSTTPGATVAAGDSLARLVRTDLVWVEVALPPRGARRLAASGVRGLVLEDPESEPVRVEEGLSLVSVAPEVSPRTGTVTVLLRAPGLAGAGIALGSTVAAQILLDEEETGIVVPESALVDDGGVPVVFLQLSGESFVRQRVTVLERQGDRARVERLMPGQRLVTRGGDAIRRSSLMASGEAEGHVH